MVANPIGIHPSLRPWHKAGVEFLLAEQNVVAPYSLCIAKAVVTGGRIGAGLDSRTGSPHASPHTSPSMGSPKRPTPPVVPAGATATHNAPPARPTSPSAGPNTAQTRQVQYSHQPQSAATHQADDPRQAQVYLPPDQWPAIWQQRLQKTAPAAVLWTYWALGEDMCVRPNPARRTLLQKMLADLGHPAGTHSFWPAALPQNVGPSPAQAPAQNTISQNSEDSVDSTATILYAAPEVFWSGVQLLKARAVVVMGSPAIKALDLPARLRPFQQTRHRGTLVVVLRDVDFLAQETTRYDAVKAFLRQALAPFGR